MEVVVTEEKKKIFRARKTMKISDRQQLESLHTTLSSATPSLSETSPPPLVNGTHKEDGQKVGDKEQNSTSDSNSPRATSPASPASLNSPAPFLSLNLSPSPASSQSPKAKDENSPMSPFHSLNFELKKMAEEDEEDISDKKGSSPSSSNESVKVTSTEAKGNQEKEPEVNPEEKKKEAEQGEATTEDLTMDSVKGSAPHSSVSSPAPENTEPMDTDNNTLNAKDQEDPKPKEEKPSSPKSAASDSSLSLPSSSHPSSSSVDIKQEKENKEEKAKAGEKGKEDVKRGSINEVKMEVDSVKVEVKKEKTLNQTLKPSRPSSTPPSNTAPEDKGSTSGLKRTLSEGHEKEEQSVKREGKRPKVEREELEAQLELKITAKAGSHHKLEKIVQQLVDERLRALQATIFDKHFDELKERVDKIDCATKHQTAINTLQAKIARLAKKFGEANQASENKKKQEALAAVAAAKITAVSCTTQAQRVLRRQAVKLQPEAPRERVVPSVGETPVLSNEEEEEEEEEEEAKEEMEEEDNKDMSRHIAMAKKLAEFSEGKCRADIKLRTITSHLESVLYHNCKRKSKNPRPDRYASYIFRYLVPYEIYCNWVAKVNYVGLLGKEALPTNLRRTMRMPVRTSVELKQTPTTVPSSSTNVSAALPALPAPSAATVSATTSTTMVTQPPILQLINSTSNAVSKLAAGITTQSPTGTLLLKTAPGSGMMATGQPLLIQLPLSMANGQAGTLVNIPVSSLSAAGSLNKPKTTASTATFILKPAPAITTAPSSASVAATVPALQASPGQMSSTTQISLARAVYQGGTGGITTPNAGVSVTTARTPTQSGPVAGAMSSASSPATSGPAATGSTAPGPPQGTSLTSKTDNQASGSTASKAAAPGARPKGSVIDLTEDDDDVQVTGVKNATVAASSTVQRPLPTISIPNSTGARASPQNTPSSNPHLTIHHRPPLDSPVKSRTATTSTPTRPASMVLPPLPVAPVPPRLTPEAERTTPPQQPQLKLVPSQTGIVLSWCVAETDHTCAAVESYHLYAYHQDNSSGNAAQQHWKKIGEVKALPLPMACTLTQFQPGSTYHFAVRAKDIYGRFGAFCEPQCTNVINSSSS
ncbi:uncharacterized protein V6R79_010520 [Siganus canaliculatus]